ncbi:MAG: N-acetylmuramoyl-L-alanine amidase [Negativicutes bacterium]|nr:N-acetylmuramoyl-L-alanine amidase [Negativicutes bacterium]
MQHTSAACGIVLQENDAEGRYMLAITIGGRRLKFILVLGLAICALNLITLRYLVNYADPNDINLDALKDRRIAIDPGHGGIDDGASGNGIVEKNVNLAISLKLAEILRGRGAQVTMTRDSDIDFYTRGKGGKRNDLAKRVDIINQSGAELFVSIHVNSIRGGNIAGAQVFYGGGRPESKLLAETMQQYLKEFPPGNKRQAKQDMDIIVLNATNIPGVLIETGFLSNKNEAGRLASVDYQQKLAEQIAKAIAYHLNQNVAR